MAKTLKKPDCVLHKATIRSVCVSGSTERIIHLGEYRSQDLRRRDGEHILEWLTSYRQAIKKDLPVDDLGVMFIKHAKMALRPARRNFAED
jgi:hypothetical protein